MKKCTKCKETKPLMAFSKNCTTKDQLQTYCKKCSNSNSITATFGTASVDYLKTPWQCFYSGIENVEALFEMAKKRPTSVRRALYRRFHRTSLYLCIDLFCDAAQYGFSMPDQED